MSARISASAWMWLTVDPPRSLSEREGAWTTLDNTVLFGRLDRPRHPGPWSSPVAGLIVDTDPGVDDAMAIMLALASPEVELLAVCPVFGNVALPATTTNAGRILALCDRSDVPVAPGAARPLVHPQREQARRWHGDDGLGGRAAALPAPAVPPDARGSVAVV